MNINSGGLKSHFSLKNASVTGERNSMGMGMPLEVLNFGVRKRYKKPKSAMSSKKPKSSQLKTKKRLKRLPQRRRGSKMKGRKHKEQSKWLKNDKHKRRRSFKKQLQSRLYKSSN